MTYAFQMTYRLSHKPFAQLFALSLKHNPTPNSDLFDTTIRVCNVKDGMSDDEYVIQSVARGLLTMSATRCIFFHQANVHCCTVIEWKVCRVAVYHKHTCVLHSLHETKIWVQSICVAGQILMCDSLQRSCMSFFGMHCDNESATSRSV